MNWAYVALGVFLYGNLYVSFKSLQKMSYLENGISKVQADLDKVRQELWELKAQIEKKEWRG
jgi:hypothetical protein